MESFGEGFRQGREGWRRDYSTSEPPDCGDAGADVLAQIWWVFVLLLGFVAFGWYAFKVPNIDMDEIYASYGKSVSPGAAATTAKFRAVDVVAGDQTVGGGSDRRERRRRGGSGGGLGDTGDFTGGFGQSFTGSPGGQTVRNAGYVD